jgi:glycosyltransferase involved in cell wall biosynthesis
MTMHGNMTMTDAWRRRAALRWAFRQGQGVVAVSAATKRQLDRDLSLGSDELRVIRNGIPVRQGDPRPVRDELGVRPDERLILAVGNLDRRKGHIYLLEALAMLQDEGLRSWRVAIAGGRGGDERPRLEAFAAAHGFGDRLHVLTHRDDIPNLQAAADIFAMPSLWEGLPLALLEALLAGTACVASDTSGIPEAIRDGQDGLLAPPGDSAGLAKALRRLVTDDTFRETLARQGQERALREFTIGVMTDAYEKLFERGLRARSRIGSRFGRRST